MTETSSSASISTKLERIAQLARQSPTMVLTTLAHHIDAEWLHEAYRRTRKDGATGIDRETAQEFAEGLEERLQSLLERAKTGSDGAGGRLRARLSGVLVRLSAWTLSAPSSGCVARSDGEDSGRLGCR